MIRLANSRLALCCAECGHRWEIDIDTWARRYSGPECPDCGGWVWSGDVVVPRGTPLTGSRWAS